MKSDNAKKGIARAPHRSLFYAMGYTDEELEKLAPWNQAVKDEILERELRASQGSTSTNRKHMQLSKYYWRPVYGRFLFAIMTPNYFALTLQSRGVKGDLSLSPSTRVWAG